MLLLHSFQPFFVHSFRVLESLLIRPLKLLSMQSTKLLLHSAFFFIEPLSASFESFARYSTTSSFFVVVIKNVFLVFLTC